MPDSPGWDSGIDWSWLDALEHAENQFAAANEFALRDEATLERLAHSWKNYLGAHAFVHPDFIQYGRSTMELRRGGGPPGLEEDYPSELVDLTKMAWTAAAQTLSFQHAFVPMGHTQAAKLGQLALALSSEPSIEFAPHRGEEVLRTRRLVLRCIIKDSPGEPCVLIGSLVNRWYILDFLRNGSFIEMLKSLGRPVYVVEWLPPGDAPDDASLGDLCAEELVPALEWACRQHNAPGVSLLGYSMGGTLAAITAVRYPELVQRVASVCGPVEFDRGGLFAKWFSKRFLDVDVVTSAFSRIPAHLVHLPFWWLRPSIKVGKLTRLARNYSKRGYVRRFLAAEVWNHDNVDMARGAFRSWTGELYQRDALVKGDFEVDGKRVGLSSIRCPVLAVSGTQDTIAPPEAVEALVHRTSSAHKRIVRLEAAHIGVLTNPKHLAEQADAFREWLSRGAK